MVMVSLVVRPAVVIRVDVKSLRPSTRRYHVHGFDDTSGHSRVYTFYYSLVPDTPRAQEILRTVTQCFCISLLKFAHSVQSLD